MSTAVTDIAKVPPIERIGVLAPGDVYKRLEESYGNPKFVYGHVLDIINNGDKIVLSALEFDGYPMGASIKTYPSGKSGKELELFPSTPEEIQAYIDEMVATAENQVRSARESLFKAERTLALVHKFRDDLSNGDVTVPITTNRR